MNILVVDDEPLIHISIEKLIQSCAKEDCVFHAFNGNEMLKALSEQDFALAFVDIKMPGPSGLEAIKKARDISPFTRYYIMTGFNEFEYAKQAVKLQVDDYLMKPLDLKTIQETLTAARLHVHLNLEREKNVFRNWLESTLNHRNSFFNEFSGHFCSLMTLTIDKGHISTEEIHRLFLPYNDHLVSLFTDDGLILLCFCQRSDSILEMYRRLASLSYPEDVACFASSITRSPEELKAALSSLSERACLRVLLGLNRFYHLTPLLDYTRQELDLGRSCLALRDAYRHKDYTAFSSQSQLILAQLSSQQRLSKYLEHISDFLCLVLNMPAFASVPDIAALKENLAQKAKTLLAGPADDTKVQSIIRFIQKHYQENISAAELSERFDLSPNYISNLLKSTLGIRYNDYVTQLRLGHARELLISTHSSIKEISSACGYYSQSHFTRLFLEREGCTPSEYRKTGKLKIDES